MSPEIVSRDAECRGILIPEQYRVTRKKGAERTFTGKYHNFEAKGTSLCYCINSAALKFVPGIKQ